MGYGLAYLAIIGFYSYLKNREQTDDALESHSQEVKGRQPLNSLKSATRNKVVKINQEEQLQSPQDSLVRENN